MTDSQNARSTTQTNMINYMMNAENNVANLALARAQNDFDLKMWHLNNNYNSPREQFKRLTEAGLSSAAAAQAVANFESQPLQSADLANQKAAHFDQMQPGSLSPLEIGRMMLENIGAALDNASKAVEVQNKEPLIMTELDAKQTAIAQARQSMQQDAAMFPHSERAAKYYADGMSNYENNMRLNNLQLEWQIKRVKQDFGWLDKLNQKQYDEMEAKIKNLGQEYENLVKTGKNIEKTGKQIDASISNIKADTAVKTAQKASIEQNTENAKEEKHSLELKNYAQKLQNILVENGSPESSAHRVAVMVENEVIPIDKTFDVFSTLRNYQKSVYSVYDGDEIVDDFMHSYFEGDADTFGLKFGKWNVGVPGSTYRSVKKFFQLK